MAESQRLGANFSIDISNLRAGLKEANQLIKESQSQFKAAAAGMDDWTKSEEGLTAKLKSLTTTADAQRAKVDALKQNYARLIKEGLDPTSTEASRLRTQINNEEAALAKTEKEIKDNTDALRDLKNKTADATDATDDLSDATDEMSDASERVQNGVSSFSVALGNLISNVIQNAVSKIKDLSKEVVELGSNFEASMSKVQAVSGASADDMEKLTAKAKEMGAKTVFSASESADALNYMAMAGWKTEDMLGGLEGIMNLAAASGADLATTSDIVTDALTAMGYSAKDAGRLADVMAAASSNANTNVEMMGQTFQYAAPVVGALGYSMEDTAIAIGLMANAGIKGEKAGTALRAIMTRLAAPPKDAATEMGALGISITDASGNMKSLDTVIGDLRKAFDGLSETEQAAAAKNLAGQEAMSGLLAIVNAAPADFEKLTKAVRESDGAAQDMANTMTDNLGGDITLLKSQLEGIAIEIYDNMSPALRESIKGFSDFAGSVDWEDFGKRVGEALGKVADGFKWILENKDAIIAGITGIATAFLAFKVVTIIQKVTAALKGMTLAQAALNAVMAMNPIGLIVAAVAGLVAAFIILWKKCDGFREFWINLWNGIKNAVSTAATAISDFFSDAWEKIKGAFSAAGEWFSGIWENIKNAFSSVGAWFSEKFSAAWSAIKKAFEPFVKFFKTIFDNVKIIFSNVAQIFGFLFGKAKEKIEEVFAPVKEFFFGIWESVKSTFSAVGTWFSEKFSEAWTKIKEAFAPVGEFFSNMWSSIKDAFSSVGSWFSEKFSEAWTKIKEVFRPVGEFFGDLWDKIKQKFTDIGQKVGDAIGGAFKTAINKVLETAENVLNAPIRAINSLISKINEIPGLSLTKLNEFELPRLAHGGVVKRATTALIGEDGDEAIIPLEKNKQWISAVAKELAAQQKQGVVINQTNNYSQAHSRYEIYKSKQQTAAAVRLAMAGA